VAVRFAAPEHPPTLEEEAVVETALFHVLQPACELDMVVLNDASPLLRWNVAQHGIPLYCASDKTWTLFRIQARRHYEDTARFRSRRWQMLLERLGHGGTQR
jgi:hypothetical protein